MPRKHEYFLFTLQKIFCDLNLFDFSLRLKGFPIKEAEKYLKSIQNKDDDDFKTYIETKKQDIVSYHLKHNNFYKAFAKNSNPLDWNSIPIMTKRDLQQSLNLRLTNGFSTKNTYKNKTSGSSGDPFIFAKDKFCHALTWAIIKERYAWYNIILGDSKEARFYGIPLNKKGYYKERLKDVLSNRFRFSVFDLSNKQFKKNLKKFKSTKFDYINGYTSAIVQFAKYLKKEHIVLSEVCPTLKACLPTSEMLFESDKTLIENQFGVPVINEYGAAEFGLIAFENKQKEWLVVNENLFVEILDDNNNTVENGKEGRVVITSLYNKAHPFIRYDIGDIGTFSKTSTPRQPVLKKLIGRTNDIVKLPSGKQAVGLTFYYVTKTVIEDDANVKEFIIEQLKLDTFKISYTSDFEISKEKETQIKQAVETYLEPNLTIILERKEALLRSNRGKLKQFKSFVND